MGESDWAAKKAAMSLGKGGKEGSAPELSWAKFYAAFFDSLRRDLGLGAEDPEPAIRAALAELETERAEWVRSPQDSQSFMLISMVLAGYQMLIQQLDRDAALNALRHAFTQMWGDWIRAGTAAQLDAAPDPS